MEDMRGEEIVGSFYPWELQEIYWNKEKKPNQVHKTRVRQGKREWLASFHGYPPNYFEWIDEEPNL